MPNKVATKSRHVSRSLRLCERHTCRAPLPVGRKTPRCAKCERKAVVSVRKKYGNTHVKEVNRIKSVRWYGANKEYGRAAARKYRRNLRLELIAAYGSVCFCCGESEEAFLTLEHRKRDGKAHRVRVGGHNGASVSVWADLRRRKWPQRDFGLLCFNCNHASWKLGVCPHQKRKDAI